MDNEPRSNSVIVWISVVGTLLVIVASGSAYILANPESFPLLFGKKTIAVRPLATENGSTKNAHVQPAHTKHYANIFFEFDYPDSFTVTEEIVNAENTAAGKEEKFGSSMVTLSSASGEGYVVHVSSTANGERQNMAQVTLEAKNEFFARIDRGANDSFQDITIGDSPAYKNFTSERIHIGIPGDSLNYAAEITWGGGGVKNTANDYLGVIEDSFTRK